MTRKENALRTIRFGNPEYVMGGIPTYTLSYTGANHEGYEGGGHSCPVGTTWFDIWGTGWQKEHEGVMGFPNIHPLPDTEMKWPDPNDGRICGKIYEMRKNFEGGDCFLGGSHRDTLWEKSYMLAGMENMMMWLYERPEYAREILRRIMDFQLGIAEHYLKCGVEIVGMGDDLGTQHGLLIGRNLLEEFFVPEYKRLFGLYKKHGVLVNFHSCGHVEPILDMFVGLGVDVLNPVQASANDLSKFKGRIAVAGGIPTALIMTGTEAEIEAAVRDTIGLFGRNGGYFCAPDQGMPFPEKNIAAFHAAVEKYGGM